MSVSDELMVLLYFIINSTGASYHSIVTRNEQFHRNADSAFLSAANRQ